MCYRGENGRRASVSAGPLRTGRNVRFSSRGAPLRPYGDRPLNPGTAPPLRPYGRPAPPPLRPYGRSAPPPLRPYGPPALRPYGPPPLRPSRREASPALRKPGLAGRTVARREASPALRKPGLAACGHRFAPSPRRRATRPRGRYRAPRVTRWREHDARTRDARTRANPLRGNELRRLNIMRLVPNHHRAGVMRGGEGVARGRRVASIIVSPS